MLCLIIRTEGGIHSITHTYANLNGEMADEQTLILEEINVTVVEELIAGLIEQRSQCAGHWNRYTRGCAQWCDRYL